jgi:hypothetical protein
MLFVVSFCWAAPAIANPPARRSVYLLGAMSDADTVAVTTALCTCEPNGVVLFESQPSALYVRAFLEAWKPQQVHKVSSPADVWTSLFPKAAKVVVCPPQPRGQLLQAACLAGVLRAPLVVTGTGPSDTFRQQVKAWQTEEIYAIGDAGSFWKDLRIRTVRLKDEAAVQASYVRHLLRQGRIEALVVANPYDQAGGKGAMSTLAPWIALQKRGMLLLTKPEGDNVRSLVEEAVKRPGLTAVDALVLAGHPSALPAEKRDNPLAGKDDFVEAEPLTPSGDEPGSFATGRIFHDDPAVVALMLARPRLWQQQPDASRAALVVSNPGGGLPLVETFSRTTALELANAGFQTSTFFNTDANRPDVRAVLPKQTIFLWEGHHSTLIRDYQVHRWKEPLWPSLIFLQSCLALEGPKALPFLERGAVGVLGSASRTYSGSGGALALSYFDALIYEKQSVGAALRHAKNFLLCFALLKENRLGDDTKLTGANRRTALAFTLWGDPTLHVPLPPPPPTALTPITHELRGNVLTVTLPQEPHDKVAAASFRARALPNARLAGLLAKTEAGMEHPIISLIFREVRFPKAPPGKTPTLHSRLPEANWVFIYDPRRATGYLLIRPRAKDTEEIRFTVDW